MLLKRESAILLTILGVSCPTKPVSFDTWAGVVMAKDGKVCFEIQNPSLQENSMIRMVNPALPQTASVGRVGVKDESCVNQTSGQGRFHGYQVHLTGEAGGSQMPAIGIVNHGGDFQKDGDLLSADLDGDRKPEYFRWCASTEGIHFSIWTGKPLTGRLRWHHYHYLGHDVSPNCTGDEVAFPK